MWKPPSFFWCLSGKKTGPTVTVLAGIHGNELPGLTVLRALLAMLGLTHQKPGHYYDRPDIAGCLYLGFGNPEAILKGQRASAPGEDLNRCFHPERLQRWPRRSDSSELRRARELALVLEHSDYLVDLHATILPSPPFAGCEEATPRHLELARYLPVEHVLTNARGAAPGAATGTTDNYVDRFGGQNYDWLAVGPPSIFIGSWVFPPTTAPATGLYYEVGHYNDHSPQPTAVAGVWQLIMSLLAPAPVRAPAPGRAPQKVWAIAGAVHQPSSSFQFEFAAGKEVGFTPVEVGNVVGYQRLPSGDQGEVLVAPSAGVLVLQNDSPAENTPLAYLATPYTP